MALRTVGVKLVADISGYSSKIRQAGEQTAKFSKELQHAARTDKLDGLADRAGVMGLALGGAFAYAVKSAADFDKQMSAVSAATHAGTRELNTLREAALKAGKETQYSATEAAKGITELSKAGVATGQILGGGLKGALALAAAGQIDVAEAAETAASAMTQFKLSGDKVPHVADLLAAAAGKAQGSVHDMGAALNQAGLVAAQTGLSIEETTGGLAAFANAGLIGSDAGTSFKQMLLMLQAPSEKTSKLMGSLGISLYDSQGQFIGLAKFAGQLRNSLKDLTPEARAAAMAQIFGADATRAASIMYEQGADGIQKWIGKVNEAGYAQATASKLTDNLAGDVERLKGSLETMAIEAGSGANGGLRVLVKALNEMVDQFSKLPGAVSSSLVVLAGVGGALLLAGAGWIKLRRSVAETLDELRKTGPAGDRAANGLGRVASAAGKAAAAFAVLQAADMIIAGFQDNLNPKTDALATGLERFAVSGKTAGEMSRVLGDDVEKLDGQFQILADTATKAKWARGLEGGLESIIPGLKGTDKSLANTKERVVALDQALAGMVSGGKSEQAAQAFDQLAKKLAISGVNMDEFKAQFPEYAAALEVAAGASSDAASATGKLGSAATGAAAGQGELKEALDTTTQKMIDAGEAVKNLNDALKAQSDPVFGLLKAQEKLAAKQKEVAEATKKHGKNSLEAKEALRELAAAALDVQGNAAALGATFDGKMTPSMRATLKAAGLTEAEIRRLEHQFGDAQTAAEKFDGKYAAQASAPGATEAERKLLNAYTAGNKFAGPYKADIKVDGYSTASEKLGNLLVAQQALSKGISVSAARSAYNKNAFAEGGWTGPGSKYEPAGVVHADEFVVQKSSRRKFERQHPGVLNAINESGELPTGYAAGGHVWPFVTTASGTKIPTKAQAMAAVTPAIPSAASGGSSFTGSGNWPSSPGAQRGDSGVWHKVVALIKSTGPVSGSFGNSYRPGDPKWHGSGRAVDWMGFNQDALASFLAARNPLELIHRTKHRDYAYTRGRNKGSFNNALMEAHRNHVHIAMAGGGTINEHVVGVGKSGATYEFGERGPERVSPLSGYANGGLVTFPGAGGGIPQDPSRYYSNASNEAFAAAYEALQRFNDALKANGRTFVTSTAKGRENQAAIIAYTKAAMDAARVTYAETGSVKEANEAYSIMIGKLDAVMKKSGFAATARKNLIKAYSEQPVFGEIDSSARISNVQNFMALQDAGVSARNAFAWTTPTFATNTASGRAELNQLFSYLAAAKAYAQSSYEASGSKKTATSQYGKAIDQLRAILAAAGLPKSVIDSLINTYGRIKLESKSNRWGGLYDYAADGALNEAKLATGGPTRYAWAEAATGGELFAPKRGNLAKTRAQVGWAVSNWWGGQVSWNGQGTGRGQQMTITAPIRITLGSEVIEKQVDMQIDMALGQINDITVYQR